MDKKEMEAFLVREPLGRLALVSDGAPYIVPMPFLYEAGVLYIPFRKGGRKQQALQQNPNGCFEVDWWAFGLGEYASILLEGPLSIVDAPEDTHRARILLTEKYQNAAEFPNLAWSGLAMGGDAVLLKMEVISMSGLKANEQSLVWVPLLNKDKAPEIADPLVHLEETHKQILDFFWRWELKAQETLWATLQEQAALVNTLLRFHDDVLEIHTRQEEEALFPRIERELDGPVACMLEEHRQANALLAQLMDDARALMAGEAVFGERAVPRVRALAQVFRQHIQKEDQVLYPMARNVLDATQLAQIAKDMTRITQGAPAP